MKYTPSTESIPQSSRRAVNEKLLYLIDNNCCEAYGITKQDIFQGYTGDGGLHGLSRKNYRSYHTYSEAKKELENGQFFTPPALCQFVVDCLQLERDDLVADLTCGMGNFFNVMPVEANVYGCELDTKAFKVASYLYPEANLVNKDIRNYMPQVRFDYVVGNPPFNLQWMAENGKEYLSQLYYCLKAAQFLKPLGILALIVPNSFLADSFSDSSMIRKMEAQFRFLGQILLPDDTFAQMGVSHFPIKLQFWQKKGVDSETPARYHTGMDNDLSGGIYAGAAQAIHMSLLQMPKAMLKENRAKILRELAKERQTSASFTYTVEKMLYQIRIHPSLKDRYAQCCAYLHRFYTETQPPEMRYEEWCKRRLTEAKVLHYLRQTLRRQNRHPERDEIHLVKRDYSFAYKGYSAAVRRRMSEELRQPTGSWAEEIVAIGVRHTVVLDAYAAALREAFPNRPLFIVTGATTTFAKRRALRQTLRESGNGILLCTQQSLPSSVNFEFVNKVIIPELHYNNSRMSQFYMRFIRFNSVDWKDIYFLTYAQSIESNLMQMILAKEKLNLFMKGDEADMDDIYERFGVDYDLTSLLLYRDIDEDGRFSIRWGEQEIA